MLTNKAFELNPEQLRVYNNWITDYVKRLAQEDEDVPFAQVEVIFTLTNIGREVVARIPDSDHKIILEDL